MSRPIGGKIMENVMGIPSSNEGTFVDYSIIETLAKNDNIINKKITHVTVVDNYDGHTIYFDEGSKILIKSGRVEGWNITKGKNEQSSTINLGTTNAITPNIQLSVNGSTSVTAVCTNVTNNSFTINAWNRDTTSNKTVDVMWTAICVGI